MGVLADGSISTGVMAQGGKEIWQGQNQVVNIGNRVEQDENLP
jgi:hypothetical protein